MIEKHGVIYKFTSQDLCEETGMTKSHVRSRLIKLLDSEAVKFSHQLRPSNQKVYLSKENPLLLLERFVPEPEKLPESGFFNNPFNLKNALDWRWRYEEFFN